MLTFFKNIRTHLFIVLYFSFWFICLKIFIPVSTHGTTLKTLQEVRLKKHQIINVIGSYRLNGHNSNLKNKSLKRRCHGFSSILCVEFSHFYDEIIGSMLGTCLIIIKYKKNTELKTNSVWVIIIKTIRILWENEIFRVIVPTNQVVIDRWILIQTRVIWEENKISARGPLTYFGK